VGRKSFGCRQLPMQVKVGCQEIIATTVTDRDLSGSIGLT
jgi:hypothetical protein